MPTKDYDAALSYQSGNYCMLIWDNYNTNSADALESLAEILKPKEDEKSSTVLLKVNALSMENWETKDYTTKVLKEAANLYAFDAPSPDAALSCIQACVNYLANVCHQTKKDMNDRLFTICGHYVTKGYQEIEVED